MWTEFSPTVFNVFTYVSNFELQKKIWEICLNLSKIGKGLCGKFKDIFFTVNIKEIYMFRTTPHARKKCGVFQFERRTTVCCMSLKTAQSKTLFLCIQ